MGLRLLDLFVEFSTRGHDAVEATLDKLSKTSSGLVDVMDSLDDGRLKNLARATETVVAAQERLQVRVKAVEVAIKLEAFRRGTYAEATKATAKLQAEQMLLEASLKRAEVAATQSVLRAGGYDQAIKAAAALSVEQQKLTLAMQQAKATAEATYAPALAKLAVKHQELEANQRRTAAAAKMDLVKSGGFDKAAQAIAAATVEEDKLAKAMERAIAVAKAGGEAAYRLQQIRATAAKVTTQAMGGVNTAVGMASNTLLGYAQAGLRASHLGSLLNFQTERLSRALGGLLAPEFRKLSELVGRLAGWIERLNDGQKKAVAIVLQSVVAFKALSMAATALNISLGPVGIALMALGALMGTAAMGGLGGFGDAIGEIGKALKPLMDVIGELATAVMTALQPVFDAFREMAPVIKQVIEVLADAIRQAMPAIIKIAEVIADIVVKQMETWTKVIEKLLPAFARMLDALIPVIEIVAELVEALRPLIDLAMVIVGVVGDGLVVVFEAWATILEIIKPLLEAIAKSLKFINENKLNVGILPALLGLGKDDDKKSKKKKKEDDNRGSLPKTAGGFESADATWQRIAQSSVKAFGGKSIDERQLDAIEKGNKIGERTNELIERQKPPLK